MDNKNISIIGGAGHVGAPLGLSLSSKGFNVTLIDKDQKNIESLNEKNAILEEVANRFKKMVKKRILATSKFEQIKILNT